MIAPRLFHSTNNKDNKKLLVCGILLISIVFDIANSRNIQHARTFIPLQVEAFSGLHLYSFGRKRYENSVHIAFGENSIHVAKFVDRYDGNQRFTGTIPSCLDSQDKYHVTVLQARRRRRSYLGHDDDDDDDESNSSLLRPEKGIPQLPASVTSKTEPTTSSDAYNNEAKIPLQLKKKLQLQYTCNVCDTRNTHSISRIAYSKGVVITRCKGCNSQHLIADHLGYCDYKGGFEGDKINTIEDYFNNVNKNVINSNTEIGTNSRASTNQTDPVVVNRVSPEVFELEKMLSQYDMNSGAIVTDDGKLAME